MSSNPGPSIDTPPIGAGANVINRSSQENSSWGYDIPLYEGSGGAYTSLADLRTTGLSILNSKILPPTATREWMKPHSGTRLLVELVGAPWEITRLMIPVSPASNRTRVCDLYLKAGGNGDYISVIALSPDHGLGYSILVAGSNATDSRWPIRDALGETFVRAAEYAAAENARDSLSGTFASNSSEGTKMTLTVDDDEPGLGLESFHVNGENTIGNAAARLYPTGLYADGTSLAAQYKAEGTILASHRMITSGLPLAPRAAVEGGQSGDLFDHSFVWGGVGFFGSLDEFILVDGRLTSIRAPYYDLVFKRVGS
ncbi:hypothetical protein LA080_007933 [Diaporthe eres]|nr:hypothetical protein LA080_007933 [Diaporthe eres]